MHSSLALSSSLVLSSLFVALAAAPLGRPGPAPAVRAQAEEAARAAAAEAVRATLEDFQDAGRRADTERFFGHLAPDLVYLGTDAAERDTRATLRERLEPYFAQGGGLTSRAVETHVFLAEDARTAWFDARLERERIGELRASGVLRKREGRWRIVQYNLSLPVPNEAVRDVVKLIRAAERTR